MTQAGPSYQTLFLNKREVQRVLNETLLLWRSRWPTAADPCLYPEDPQWMLGTPRHVTNLTLSLR